MATGIPKMLDYGQVKPRGMQTEFKTMRFSPLTSFNKYVTNDIVRFWIPMIKGFWDPYKSYIEIEVQATAADFPYGHGVQVDNSGSSFISEMTVFCDSKQVQRIQQYDSVAALLHDAMVTPGDQFGKQYEGFGYNSHTSMGFNIDDRRTTTASYANGEAYTTTISTGIPNGAAAISTVPIYTTGYHPVYPRYIDTSQAGVGHYSAFQTNNGGNNVISSNLSGSSASYRLPHNAQVANINTGGDWKSQPPAVRLYPYMANLQQFAIYVSVANSFGDPQILAPRPYLQPSIQSSCYGCQGTNAKNFNLYGSVAYTRPTTAANVSATALISAGYNDSTVRVNGYTQAYSEQLSNASNQPLIAPTHPITWIHKGQFNATPVASTKRVFQIPIISALLGVLIPAESYKLIPMEALQNLMLEFRLNQYAMFTSGYLQDFITSSAPNRALQPMSTQLQRAWAINRIQIFGAIYSFDDFVSQMVSQRLRSGGITLSSNGWALGPRFSISNTSLIKNTWQINAGYESLKTLCFRIQSDDYQKYSFCRKHYYYSGNITQLQLKISNTYIPPQPIDGHAGNILPVGNDKSNAPFIIELHKTFGKLFNIGQNMYINATNFAVNDRPYDVTNKLPFATANGTTQTITNIDTAMGLPLFHQNRCVGRALYAFDLQALPHEPAVISGLNTLKWRPFEVIIDTDSSVTNNRDSTLIFFLNYDVIFQLQAGEPPQVFGKG